MKHAADGKSKRYETINADLFTQIMELVDMRKCSFSEPVIIAKTLQAVRGIPDFELV